VNLEDYKFQIGDLVQFDFCHIAGVVTAVKMSEAFEPSEKITDVKVLWTDGEEFWCLDFTLLLLSKRNNINN